MGVATVNGERQRKVKGPDAKEQKYSPRRRSALWTFGDSHIKAKGLYYPVYAERVPVEIEKTYAEGKEIVSTTPATVEKWNAAGIPVRRVSDEETKSDSNRTVGHINQRAKRFMEKRILRDFWKAWRRTQDGAEE